MKSSHSFFLYNTLFLGMLLGLCWIKEVGQGTFSNIIYWPGSYFCSLSILSPVTRLTFQHSNPLKKPIFIRQHMVFSMLFGLCHLIVTGALILLLERFFALHEHYDLLTFPSYFSTSWHYALDGILWYWAYVMLCLFFHTQSQIALERERLKQTKAALLQSDLKTLRNEINPHFLFNAMNTIAMKVRLSENKTAVSMIAGLNDLLRTVLSKNNGQLIPLSTELSLLEKYLSIEKIRFGNQVEIHIEFADLLLPAKVPQMLLQPLVENAFKHGIQETLALQQISISGKKINNNLELSVYNTAPESMLLIDSHRGIGLPNIIHRLRRHYGTDFRFQSLNSEHGIAFIITIPFTSS